jgi:hypothetical protein
VKPAEEGLDLAAGKQVPDRGHGIADPPVASPGQDRQTARSLNNEQDFVTKVVGNEDALVFDEEIPAVRRKGMATGKAGHHEDAVGDLQGPVDEPEPIRRGLQEGRRHSDVPAQEREDSQDATGGGPLVQINRGGGVEGKKGGETAHVVVMAMGNDHGPDAGQIDPQA